MRKMIHLSKSALSLLCMMLMVAACRKDIIEPEGDIKPNNIPKGVKTVAWAEMLKNVGSLDMGPIAKLVMQPSNKRITVKDDVSLAADSVSQISDKNGLSYSIPVIQNANQKATFQNIIVYIKEGKSSVYLLTYHPTSTWAKDFKENKQIPFQGIVTTEPLELNLTGSNKAASTKSYGCTSFVMYILVAHPCYSGQHWPGDSGCKGEGQLAYTSYEPMTTTICVEGSGGGGASVSGLIPTYDGSGTGGGVPTYTTLPANYNPDCVGWTSSSKSSPSIKNEPPPSDCPYYTPNPFGLISDINKITVLTALDYAKQQFLWDMAVNQSKPFAADLLSFLNNNEYSLPNIRFVNWAIEYLYNNPSASYSAFKAQYLQLPATTVAKISSLSIILDATIEEQVWMYQNLARFNEIDSFLLNSQLPNKNSIAKQHLDHMMGNAGYLAFVDTYSQDPLASGKMWWDNEDWLLRNNAYNRDQANSAGYFISLGMSPTSTEENEDNNDYGSFYTTTGYDTNIYGEWDVLWSWSNIPNVVDKKDFVGWNYPGVRKNCMDYCKKQLEKKGLQISDYFTDQTILSYSTSTGTNAHNTLVAVNYIRSQLSAGHPVIVGVDDAAGSKNPNTDATSDHFVVIIGAGIDNQGNKYFTFFDNAENSSLGTSNHNKLYWNPVTGVIAGDSMTAYARKNNRYTFRVTQVRKSKPL